MSGRSPVILRFVIGVGLRRLSHCREKEPNAVDIVIEDQERRTVGVDGKVGKTVTAADFSDRWTAEVGGGYRQTLRLGLGSL